jgi:type II secretory pathway component PulF
MKNDLSASLGLLHENEHPAGLSHRAVENLDQALLQGLDGAEAARRAGLDASIVRVLSAAGPMDLRAAIHELLGSRVLLSPHLENLRGAAFYPLVLMITILLAGLVLAGLALPGLAPLASGPIPGSWALMAGLLVGCLLLGALSLSVLRRLRLPFLGAGHEAVEICAVVERTRILCALGRPLPTALRASAAGCEDALRVKGEALARHVEAGLEGEPAMSPLTGFETRLLLTAARHGVLPGTLSALSENRRRMLDRVIPEHCARIHVIALLLAGLTLLLVAAPFFYAWSNALLGFAP